MDFKQTLRRYYEFSKPGIVYANVLTVVAGYLFAAQFHLRLQTLAGLVIGMTLVIIGACSANNIIDRRRDAAMKRTAKRSLVVGTMSAVNAAIYAVITLSLGVMLLLITQNALTVILAVIAYVDYVILYGVAKRTTVHGTLVGCVSGAIPLVAGYTAVVGHLNTTAWLLFALMVTWQMAHFYGIALYRQSDYAAAGFPVMPVTYGARATKPQVIAYMVLFIVVASALVVHGAQGYFGGSVLVAAGVFWLIQALRQYNRLLPDVWGKQVFLHSLLVILVLAGSLSVGSSLF